MGFVIAVDGPAASGKGTIAQQLARAYGLPCLDSGLLYRAVGVTLQRAGGDLDDAAQAEAAARALGLAPDDILLSEHAPQVVSVGLIFLVVQLASRDALRRARPDPAGYAALLPLDGARSIYAYTTDCGAETPLGPTARMFTGRMTEDPATGSATGAATALRAALRGKGELRLRVAQGVDMGRASLLLAHAEVRDDGVWAGVAGQAVVVMEGTLPAPAAA